MLIFAWARRHGVSYSALQELLQAFGTADALGSVPDTPADGSEAHVQGALRLNASKAGGRLWRNNSGAGYMQDGSFVRWGLGNDSTRVNKVFKSPDLVGIKPVVIAPSMVGLTIGQLWAREAKPEAWHYTATEHEQAQLNAINLINSLGGDAAFANRGDAL